MFIIVFKVMVNMWYTLIAIAAPPCCDLVKVSAIRNSAILKTHNAPQINPSTSSPHPPCELK